MVAHAHTGQPFAACKKQLCCNHKSLAVKRVQATTYGWKGKLKGVHPAMSEPVPTPSSGTTMSSSSARVTAVTATAD